MVCKIPVRRYRTKYWFFYQNVIWNKKQYRLRLDAQNEGLHIISDWKVTSNKLEGGVQLMTVSILMEGQGLRSVRKLTPCCTGFWKRFSSSLTSERKRGRRHYGRDRGSFVMNLPREYWAHRRERGDSKYIAAICYYLMIHTRTWYRVLVRNHVWRHEREQNGKISSVCSEINKREY